MKKLTAEKCREQFEEWWQENQHNGNPPRFGWDHYRDGETYSDDELQTLWEVWKGSRESLEIALPILEQQDHEKSIIAGQLEAVRDSLSLTPHQDAIISCAIDRLNVLTLRTLELSQSLIKQQERCEGWIEWDGGECPVHAHFKVEVKHRDSLCASTVSRAHDFDWNHYGYKFGPDIIAYRIIQEQPTNQNGEQ